MHVIYAWIHLCSLWFVILFYWTRFAYVTLGSLDCAYAAIALLDRTVILFFVSMLTEIYSLDLSMCIGLLNWSSVFSRDLKEDVLEWILREKLEEIITLVTLLVRAVQTVVLLIGVPKKCLLRIQGIQA